MDFLNDCGKEFGNKAKNKIKDNKILIIVTIIIIVLGVILHFVYDWSGENNLVGYISPVNESVWEHLKLLVFPLLGVIFVEIIYLQNCGDKINNKWYALFVGLIVGLLLIIILFYTYTGAITEKSVPVIDIGIFVLSAIVATLVVHRLFKMKQVNNTVKLVSVIGIIVIVSLMLLFTYNPPNLPIFKEELEQ